MEPIMEIYDDDPVKDQQKRLEAAAYLSTHGIPAVLWGTDATIALSPDVGSTFPVVQSLLVPDNLVQAAAETICHGLPYVLSEPPPGTQEYRRVDPDQPTCYPQSSFVTFIPPLEEITPWTIMIHPASYFQFDILDGTRSFPLEVAPEVRCPTRTAFVDSIITTALDPPLGYMHRQFHGSLMVYLSYIVEDTLRSEPRILTDGQLEPESRSLVNSLKEENRPYLEGWLRGSRESWDDEVRKRREVLQKTGIDKLAFKKPLPIGLSERIPFPDRIAPRLALRNQKKNLSRTLTSNAVHGRPVTCPAVALALRNALRFLRK
ncbi:hypothetical protein EST38_g2045 [Candolleomyces aberdarensis]|uniref:Uncharacterized protein n=1 Tax=Candolleomyces aberdarensis TaxID=2316362 RepID=A0A4Q2DWZ6_9AGAR|nr:hypothetical protein EST38_g2045 [Candolleomyces aberdarensis]